jgi:NTE family protein
MAIPAGQRIALVLGAGGARGLAHIGVIEVLVERGYVIESVVGCSMGALVGGVFATGQLDQYRDWACSLQRSDVVRLLDLSFGLPGLIRGERVFGALREMLGEHRIEQLPIGYTAVATDLETQREVWLTRGSLWDAVRASVAIPLLMTPHFVDGRELVDGGLLAPVPIAPTRLNRVDHVVAVDVNGPVSWRSAQVSAPREHLTADGTAADVVEAHEDGAMAGVSARMAALWKGWRNGNGEPAGPKPRGMLDLVARSIDTMHAHMTRLHLAQDPPDLLIRLPSSSCAIYEFWRAEEMIARGREATAKALDRVQD